MRCRWHLPRPVFEGRVTLHACRYAHKSVVASARHFVTKEMGGFRQRKGGRSCGIKTKCWWSGQYLHMVCIMMKKWCWTLKVHLKSPRADLLASNTGCTQGFAISFGNTQGAKKSRLLRLKRRFTEKNGQNNTLSVFKSNRNHKISDQASKGSMTKDVGRRDYQNLIFGWLCYRHFK